MILYTALVVLLVLCVSIANDKIFLGLFLSLFLLFIWG
jgi:hypothetical protein